MGDTSAYAKDAKEQLLQRIEESAAKIDPADHDSAIRLSYLADAFHNVVAAKMGNPPANRIGRVSTT